MSILLFALSCAQPFCTGFRPAVCLPCFFTADVVVVAFVADFSLVFVTINLPKKLTCLVFIDIFVFVFVHATPPAPPVLGAFGVPAERPERRP